MAARLRHLRRRKIWLRLLLRDGETPFAVYTGGELAVAIGAFFLEGLLFRQTPDQQAPVQALFDELEGKTA